MTAARTSDAPGRSSGRAAPAVAAISFLAVFLTAACGDTTAPPGAQRGRGPAGAQADLPPRDPPPPAARPDRERRRPPPTPPSLEAPRPSAPSTAAGGEERADDPNSEPSLRRLLQEAFGTPTACISDATRDALGESLRVSVTARVLPSGRVLDASVSGGALSEEDVECMRQHAQTLRLRPGIPGTPRAISASIEYAVADGRVTREVREPGPRNLHPGTLGADRTLPAAGSAEGRPAGSVTPDVTLPAQAPTGTAPGYVPPSSTLPARAD